MSNQESSFIAPGRAVVNVVWLDVNSRASGQGKPLLLPNVQAINNSLYNLIQCPIGARGALFRPDYGTILYRLLFDPLDEITANKLRISLIQAIQRWEPRINLDLDRSAVTPDYNNASFKVEIYYEIVATQEQGLAAYSISTSPGT